MYTAFNFLKNITANVLGIFTTDNTIISKEELDYIKSINMNEYKIDTIDIKHDPIYKKLKGINFDYNKIKTLINNLLQNNSSIKIFDITFYLYTNFIKILKEENKLDDLMNVLNNSNMFSFSNEEQIKTSLNNFVSIMLINIDDDNKEVFKKCILEIAKKHKGQFPSIIKDISNALFNNLSENNILFVQDITCELIKNKSHGLEIFNTVVEKCLDKNIDLMNINKVFNIVIQQNPSDIYYIIDSFVQGCLLQSKPISEIQDTVLKLVKQNEQNPNNIANIVGCFVYSCLLQNKNILDIQNIISILIQDNPNNIIYIVVGFVVGCLSRGKEISDIQPVILELAKENLYNIFKIVNGFVQGCLLKGKEILDIQPVILELAKRNNIFKIVVGFVQGCLSKGKEISDIQPVILELAKRNTNNIFKIVDGFVQSCLSEGEEISDIQPVILELAKRNPNNIFDIIVSLFWGCLSQGKPISDIQPVILKLAKENPNNILKIVDGFVQGCLSKGKEISDLQGFLIQASQDKDIGIDTIYNTIYFCCLNTKVQIDSENFKQLIEIINNKDNQKKEESQKILCGIYVSDYLFKMHQNQRDKAITAPTNILQEFIDLLNEVLERGESNKIKKLEDLTIREIKTLFNDLMNIKFNQTKEGVNSNLLNTGPFLEIIISLAEHSGIDDNMAIGDLYDGLYNKKKQKEIQKKLEKGKKLTEIETFQNKLNNFCYAEIKANTEIEDLKDFITKVLKLKKEDFGKKVFKTFYVEFPGHAVTLVIDTSKSLNQFLEDNEKEIKDMVMFDSSKRDNFKRFSNQVLANIIKKIPVQEQKYQENGTCWGNTICANSSLLNKYKDYNQIIKINSITQNLEGIVTFKPQEGVQKGIVNTTSRSFGKLTDKIKEKQDYEKIRDEAGDIIEFNVRQNQLFQKPLEVFKARQKKLEELEKILEKMKKLNEIEQKIKKLESMKKKLENLKQQEQFIKETKVKDVGLIIEKYNTLKIIEGLEEKVKEELEKLQQSKKVRLEL